MQKKTGRIPAERTAAGHLIFKAETKEKNMRTYLVTGGAGFIGSNYIHYMFRKYDNEIRIINVDALTYAGNLENLKDLEEEGELYLC